MERYRPRVGDSVWVEGRNPKNYTGMYLYDPINWEHEHSQPNGIVIEVSWEAALIDHYNGRGVESYDFDAFDTKHYNPGCQHGHWLIFRY